MEHLIGKKYKDTSNGSIKTIKHVENNTIYLSDNGVVNFDIFKRHFIEVNENINENNNYVSNNFNSNKYTNELDSTNIFKTLANQVEQMKSNPNHFRQQETVNNYPDLGNSGISPETLRMWEDDQKRLAEQKKKTQILKENDPWLNQFNDNGNGEVRRIDTETYLEDLERIKHINETRSEVPNDNVGSVNNNQTSPTSGSGIKGFPKMKKTNKVKLNIVLDEMIPKIEDIKAVEALFDNVSIIYELGKEIANKYLNDRELFENMIISELEKLTKKPKAKVKVKQKVNNKSKEVVETENKPKTKVKVENNKKVD